MKEREKWVAATLKSIGYGVIATDASEVGTNMNPIAEALTGWKKEEVPLKSRDELEKKVEERTADLLKANEALRIEIRERKRAEEALLTAAQQWRTTFDGISDIVCLLGQDGKILKCNKAMTKFMGMSFREILGRPCREILHGMTLPNTECPMARMQKTLRRETLTLLLHGRWFNIAVDPLLADDGSLKGAVHIMSDITEHRRVEEERAALEEQLRQSQKMEAIGRLAGGVAHDFNNLLTVIKGYSQLSLGELSKDAQLREEIEEIQGAADRASNLTRQLLAFSRRQVFGMKVLDLNAILRDLDKMLRRVIGEDIDLVTVLGKDLGKVQTDQGQVEQAIMNLVVNARQAMPRGGKLTIETADTELEETYAQSDSAVKPGRYVMLAVSDTGCGMIPEVKDRIFEPYFTTKEMGKGTGLGLSTVYGIVKQSGGNIWVFSQPGKGSIFKIYLPRVNEPMEEPSEKLIRKELPRGGECVLVIEDEAVVRRLVVLVLKKQGYQILEASNSEEALLVCEQHKGPIHLILTDVVMPGMGGPELIGRLGRMHRDFKVLYMSGYTDEVMAHHGMQEGEVDFIQKPCSVEDLSGKVRQVLDTGRS